MTDQYAVMGNPIGHSKSPAIHAAFAAQTGESLEYCAQLVELDGFAEAVSQFFASSGKGLNITVPFKEQAWQLVDKHTERAALAGAVNTLYRDDQGLLWGDNTDGIGLVNDLQVNQACMLQGKRVLILGAGGAVKGILLPFLSQQPAEVVIANRTVSKARALAEQFAQYGTVESAEFESLQGAFDVIVNGTSASLQGQLPPLPEQIVTDSTVCYDMMYGAELTAFNCWASELGAAKCIDGLGMLVEQAAEAFAVWRQVRPSTAQVIADMRAQLRVS